MHPLETRRDALALLDQGLSFSAVAEILGVSRASVTTWARRGIAPVTEPCPSLSVEDPRAEAYAALFGYYLGDGCLSEHRRAMCLRIACDRRYPGIQEDVGALIVEVRGRGPVTVVRHDSWVSIAAYWKHWTCLFPQHGPGRKHERTLTLEPWQEAIVTAHADAFLRGLFHSDGCRVRNWATRTVAVERAAGQKA